MFDFVYLLSFDLFPEFLRMAKSAPPATGPLKRAMITMGSNPTCEDSFRPKLGTVPQEKVPKIL
jgi:hypothetical protein